MTKKKRHTFIVFIIVLAAICSIIITMRIIYSQSQKTAYIKESYYRQNVAFAIEDPYFRCEASECYRRSGDILSKGYLYAFLRLYEHDTGCTVTYEDISDYLSDEYNSDGSRRLSEQFPEIQGYIDFFWDSLKSYPQESSEKIDYISLYRISLRDGFMICNDIHDIREYQIRGVQPSDMDKAIEWAFNVSDEQKAEGYVFNTYDWSKDKTYLETVKNRRQ